MCLHCIYSGGSTSNDKESELLPPLSLDLYPPLLPVPEWFPPGSLRATVRLDDVMGDLIMDISDWIGLASMVVALCALLFTVYQGRLQRERETILLKPSFLSATDTQMEEGGTGLFTVGVINYGTGPGKIVGFQPMFKGKECELRELIDQATDGHHHQRVRLTKPAIGSSLASQARIDFGTLRCKAANQEELDAFSNLFEEARIKVQYKSFVEDEVHDLIVGDPAANA